MNSRRQAKENIDERDRIINEYAYKVHAGMNDVLREEEKSTATRCTSLVLHRPVTTDQLEKHP